MVKFKESLKSISSQVIVYNQFPSYSITYTIFFSCCSQFTINSYSIDVLSPD